MAMSKDRIEFNLPEIQGMAPQTDDDNRRLRAASDAFGISQHQAYDFSVRGTRLRVRPSQFARYVVLGFQYGARTQIAAISPKIVKDIPSFVDLSGNPADFHA